MWQLSEDNQRRLNHIKRFVENLWRPHDAPPFYFTPHGISHAKNVEEKIKQLIPDEKVDLLREQEKFALLCSAWLHDIGMIPDLFDKKVTLSEKTYHKIREDHHERSRKYIKDNYETLGLNFEEASAIGEICYFHRKKEDILRCEKMEPRYNCRLLAAFLRLADAFQIDRSRIDDYSQLYNMLLTMGMPLASEFHWLKSFWIRDIEYKHDSKRVVIYFYLSDSREKICDQDELINFTINEIKEEIFSCKNVINRSGIIYINEEDIQYKCDATPPKNLKTKFKQVISQLKIDYTASASQLAEILCNTIQYIVDSNTNSPQTAIEEIKSYKKNVIEKIVQLRPVHILIRKVNCIIENILNDNSLNTDQKLSLIIKTLTDLNETRKRAVKKIAKFSQPILHDTGSILLFGYSTIIIESLSLMEKYLKDNVKIYVCECRSKNQYNYANKLIYCDGLKYVEKLHEIGFRKLYLIPDVIAGNLIQRDLISKILFGANSVDIESKTIGHTAGHFSIVNSAKIKNVPIYIFADSCKFGHIEQNTKERICNWFTREKEILESLKKKNIKFMNPREDLLSIESIKMFITDQGMIPPEKIPKSFLEKIEECNKFPCE